MIAETTIEERLRQKYRRVDAWLDRVAEGGGVAPTRQEIEEADLAREAASHIANLTSVLLSARRVREVWMAMAGKAPPDEIQLAVALADLTAHLDAFADDQWAKVVGGSEKKQSDDR